MISIDGLMPSAYTSRGPAKIPNLRKLVTGGAWADGVEGVLPTVTFPSHTTLITGVSPAVHGIIDNRIVDPEGRSNTAWYWYAASLKAVTLPMAARARGLTAGAVAWPVTVGMPLDYVVPDFWRSDHRESLTLLKAVSRPDHLLDSVEAARGRPLGWPFSDRDRTDIATFVIRTFRPHVLLIHLIDLDGAQHAAGPGSPRALETLERVDGYVGEIVAAIDATGRRAETVIAIVSDHGFRALKMQLQPNALFKREGLIQVNARGTITEWQAYFHASGGAGFVYLKNPNDQALQERVWKLLQEVKADPTNGIAALWTRDELDRRGAHPGASFGIGMADGFYSSTAHDTLLRPSASRGGHGFDPTIPELHASLIVHGPGAAGRGSLGIVRMTQIAPTFARMLGVGLSPEADKPLW
jgi:predicted AlkP superfamily pyrophosphatase or phosphodiesterase